MNFHVLRINRYIMECKLKFRSIILNKCGELIDTLWNVNFLQKGVILMPRLRINRYIMECKCYPAGHF